MNRVTAAINVIQMLYAFFFSVHKLDALLTSRQETDSSAHLDERSKQQHVISNSQFDLQSPKALQCCFWKQHGHAFYLLPKEACV